MIPSTATKIAAAAVLAICAMGESSAQVVSKNNGIISYDANVYGKPMISNLYVLGTQLMPYDNVGAGFQMTGRSNPEGDSYNPTQGETVSRTRPYSLGSTAPGAGIRSVCRPRTAC